MDENAVLAYNSVAGSRKTAISFSHKAFESPVKLKKIETGSLLKDFKNNLTKRYGGMVCIQCCTSHLTCRNVKLASVTLILLVYKQ